MSVLEWHSNQMFIEKTFVKTPMSECLLYESDRQSYMWCDIHVSIMPLLSLPLPLSVILVFLRDFFSTSCAMQSSV